MNAQLWATANTLRGNMDATDYKHVVLPLIFLKYVSDAFEELHEKLEAKAEEGYDPEQPDEYREENVFWVPLEARWSNIESKARQEEIGATIDQAMDLIERNNESLKGVLPKNYGREDLDKQLLGNVVDVVSNIKVGASTPRPPTSWDRSMSTSWNNSPSPKAEGAGSFTPRGQWSGCWSK